jgi:hypothetical protein
VVYVYSAAWCVVCGVWCVVVAYLLVQDDLVQARLRGVGGGRQAVERREVGVARGPAHASSSQPAPATRALRRRWLARCLHATWTKQFF